MSNAMTNDLLACASVETMQAAIGISMSNALCDTEIRRLFEQDEPPQALLDAGATHLSETCRIDLPTAERLLRRIEEDDVRLGVFRELERLQRNKIRMYTLRDGGYPVHLRASYEAPPFVYIWGCYSPVFLDAVAIVGSHDCSRYGAAQSASLSIACTEAGWTVITGGESGIDRIASRDALEAGGRAVIALGAGVFAHGREHHELYERIASSGQGCIISSALTDTPPKSNNQIAGDLLCTGLSKALCVVEASGVSGALIAARAMENIWHRPVFALPGPIDSDRSSGTNHLIYAGRARPIISIERFIADLSPYQMPIQGR